MNYFCHYKNKPYRYLGVVKHSESLEDLVLYECRYENPTAKIWVRPKAMFFESVTIDGRQVPRFQKMPIEVEESATLSDTTLTDLTRLLAESKIELDPHAIRSAFMTQKRPYLFLARLEGELIGFKFGYELHRETYFSWLGAIKKQYRGYGVARELIKRQHLWCQEQGYAKIQTTAFNRFREMLVLNLRCGFEIVGTRGHDLEQGPEILLEKNLDQRPGS